MVEITNWGARLPQNRFGWQWLLFEELWTPSFFQMCLDRAVLSLYFWFLIGNICGSCILNVLEAEPINTTVSWSDLKSALYTIDLVKHFTFKGSDRQCMVVELIMQYWMSIFFRINLRPIRRFYGAYFFSKSANSIFKILIDCPFWKDDFENRFLNHSMTTTKNVTKIPR